MYMIFSDETEENLHHVMQRLSMELVTDPGNMLNILTESKANGMAVGIFAPVSGQEIYVTAIEEILMDEDGNQKCVPF